MKTILATLRRKLDLLDALAEQLPIEPNIILSSNDEVPWITVFAEDHRATVEALGTDGWRRVTSCDRTAFDHIKAVCGVTVSLYKAEPVPAWTVDVVEVPADFWAEATYPPHTVEPVAAKG